jgi:hypothetical protein
MRRFQLSVGLALLAAVVLTCLAIDLLSRSSRITQFTESGELARFKSGGGLFMNRGGFVDFEDRVLLDEIPNADFSRGGVYFFGTSTMKWGLKTWELDSAERALVHNFGIGASNHRFVAQFIRYLVEYEGLFKAGGGNVHVVLGCFWSMGKEWPTGFFTQLWGRYKLFQYDERRGIRPADLGAVRRTWRVEQARLAGFVSANAWRVARYVASGAGMRMSADRERQIGETEIRQRAIETASVADWEKELKTQLAELRALLHYLHERGVTVTVVLLPTRADYDDLPLPQRYSAGLRTVAAENQVQFADLSRLLGNDEFVDVNHANYPGLEKLHRALISLVRPDLDRLLNTQR